MMRRIVSSLLAACCLGMAAMAQDAQVVPYRGGQANGFAAAERLVFNAGYIALYTPFAGGLGDGYATDSVIRFAVQAPITAFAPFGGGPADGYAAQSSLAFDATGYIPVFTPFAGGPQDGYHEGVLCRFPVITGDTTIFLACSNLVVNLDSLVNNINFAARWNTPNTTAAGPGSYQLLINNAGKCLDTATVVVSLEVLTWNGNTSSDWHTASNWTPAKVPGAISHVIVPGGRPNACIISTAPAQAASVQVRNDATVQTANGRVLTINGTCVVLPQ